MHIHSAVLEVVDSILLLAVQSSPSLFENILDRRVIGRMNGSGPQDCHSTTVQFPGRANTDNHDARWED